MLNGMGTHHKPQSFEAFIRIFTKRSTRIVCGDIFQKIVVGIQLEHLLENFLEGGTIFFEERWLLKEIRRFLGFIKQRGTQLIREWHFFVSSHKYSPLKQLNYARHLSEPKLVS